jgi:endonuclease/exonuclease/phosphatase (EEP) superfamily protein YafD
MSRIVRLEGSHAGDENYCPILTLETTIRIAVTIGALAALVMAAVGLVVRYAPITNHTVLIVAVASPYLLLGAPLAALLSSLARRWVLAGVAVVLTAVVVAVQAPLFIGQRTADDGVKVRVMTANLYLGQADAATVVQTASAHADVLAVQELTPEAVERLSAAGLDKVFPHRALDARDYASGVGVWSRYPITESARIDGFQLAMARVRIRVDGVATDPTILVAHMPGPWPQPVDDWVGDMEAMRGTSRTAAGSAGTGCVLIAGDFNSTFDMIPFRRLLSDGYRDATEQSGAGLQLTYPANAKVPPFMGIDHVLTNRCTATSVETVALPGSDHRGLVAAVDVPRSRG